MKAFKGNIIIYDFKSMSNKWFGAGVDRNNVLTLSNVNLNGIDELS